MVFVLTSSTVGAVPLSTALASNSQWSYGVVKTVNVPLQSGQDGWVYGGNATFGYTVTIYENSTAVPNSFELSVYRTLGLAYSIRFCYGSCSAPTQWANQTYRAYERTATFANFTTLGRVLLNGTTEVDAIALENTTSFLHANVTEATDVYLPNEGQRGPHVGYLGADLRAQSAVNFTPALGLIPDTLTPGSTWNSTSAFAAQGEASWSWYYAMHRPVAPIVTGGTGTRALSADGSVSVQGAYPIGSTFTYGGVSYPAITLIVTGPFDVREGVIFVPGSVDIFGSASQPWASNATGSTSVQMSTLDLKPSSGGGFQFVASSWRYSSTAANAANSTAVLTNATGISDATAADNQVTQGVVQGQPQDADQAMDAQTCLTVGSSCAGPAGSTSHPLLGLIVVGGVVGVVAILVAVAVVSRRRRAPPPVYPNAVLYPPGAASPGAPSGAPAAPPSPPPPEDDPLSHLW